MKHKKILIPAVCLCLAVPAVVWATVTGKNDSESLQRIKKAFAPKTISSKSTDLTVGMSSGKSEADFSGIDYDDEFRLADCTFALDLLKNEISGTENVIISPYSAIQSLGMLANGADGDTLTEIEASMNGLPVDKLNEYICKWRSSQSNEGSKLTTANSLWIKDDEKLIKPMPEFLQTAVDYYAPSIFTTPFDKHTLKDINAWINKNVEGTIPKALDEIPADAVMYAVNAVEFEADWEYEYLAQYTEKGVFTDYNGKEQSVDMMKNDEAYIIEDDHALGFVKYYSGEKYAFAAILPEENMTIEEYVSGLTPEHFGELMAVSELKADSANGYTVSIPKFRYEYKNDLGDALKDMGITKAFDAGKADFSRLSGNGDGLCLSRVIHDTYIQFYLTFATNNRRRFQFCR